MKTLARHLRALWRREDGTSTMEFTLMVPAFMLIFMASFESGMLMVRHTMLERAVDMTMRELRLGHFVNPTHASLKADICSHTVIIANCNDVLKLSLEPINTTTWALPDNTPTCVDRAAAVQPVTEVNPGGAEEIMLVRVCAITDALFPTTGIGLDLAIDGQGGYGIYTETAFVNEPS